MKVVLTTDRLMLRELTQADFGELCGILQDAEAMYAYEHAFSDEEVHAWLDNQLARYARDGHGLWAVLRKEDGTFIGQCGITHQPFGEKTVHEVGYLFKKAYWNQGYATEAAAASVQYAFDALGADCVCAIIRENNAASQRVAARLGMRAVGREIKHYYGMDMPHTVYCVESNNVL